MSISGVRKSRAAGHRPAAAIYAADEDKVDYPAVKGLSSKSSRHGRYAPPGAQAQTGSRALEQHLAAKADEARRPAAGRRADLPGFLDEALLLDEAAEILLVQPDTGERLDGALQLQQREGRRHQLEHDRPVFDLAAQAAERGRQDPAMIERHRDAGAQAIAGERRPPEVAGRLGDEPRLVQELVAFEDQLLVPRTCRHPEGQPEPFLAQPPLGFGRGLGRPTRQPLLDPDERVGLAVAPILPR